MLLYMWQVTLLRRVSKCIISFAKHLCGEGINATSESKDKCSEDFGKCLPGCVGQSLVSFQFSSFGITIVSWIWIHMCSVRFFDHKETARPEIRHS